MSKSNDKEISDEMNLKEFGSDMQRSSSNMYGNVGENRGIRGLRIEEIRRRPCKQIG